MNTGLTLPEGWTIRSLRACLRTAPEYGINAAAVPFDDGLPTYLRITDISDDNRFRPSPRVSIKHPDATAYFLQEGDLVFARTGASVGKSYLYNPDDGPLVFAGFLIRVSPNPEDVQPVFLAYCTQSERYWDWVATMSIRSGQPGINGQEYGTFQLLLPLPDEQRAIAEALSDIDGLLQSMESLIAKKRAVKTGAMQQLLTGKTRLPGFRRKWRREFIGKIGSIYSGLLGKSKTDFSRGHAKYVTFLNVLDHVSIDDPSLFDDVTVGPKEKQSKVLPGDLLFNNTSETPDDLAMGSAVQVYIPELYLNSFCFGFRLYNSLHYNPQYLAYFFRGPTGRNLMYALAQGATRYNISKRQFLNLKLRMPRICEQIAIAITLSDMDAEIAALERRLDKTRALKQGVMQQLLTGRIRLARPL